MLLGQKILSLIWPFGSIIHSPSGHESSAVVLKHRHAFLASPVLPDSFATQTVHKPPQILFNDALKEPEADDQLLRELDVDYTAAGRIPLSLKTARGNVRRPRDAQAYQEARKRSYYSKETTILDWGDDEIDMPDLTDRLTVLELARISGNAYLRPDSKGWYSIDNRWNASHPFGWEGSENGFRGHIFVSEDNSTVVISIKGTSLYGSSNTATRDKLNDNRLFRYETKAYSFNYTDICML
jgi:putative lipase involved disintegration of autophagic bodies